MQATVPLGEPILAFGAAGRLAGLVVPALARRGARVRAFIRDPSQSDRVRCSGAAEVVVGTLDDLASIEAALDGAGAVFYLAPAFMPGEAEIGKAVVAAAVRAGVRRFVFSSVIHPVLSALTNHAAKAPVEEAVLNSELEYTFLHPTVVFQNFAASWPDVVKTGVISQPWSTGTRFSRVDYRDVAEAAAIALTEDRLLFGTFELCAEGRLNLDEVAALLSDILGWSIQARKSDPAKARNLPAPMLAMCRHYDHHGLVGNALTLRALLGREPRTLRAYFEELADPATTERTVP